MEYSVDDIISDKLKEMKLVYQSDSRPWIIGYSGGKDSTVVVHLAYEMLHRLDQIGRASCRERV